MPRSEAMSCAEKLETVVRPAREEEIQFLTEKALKQGLHPGDMRKSIVFVVEHGGIISGFVQARMAFWQIEPLCIFDEFRKHAPPMTLRRAVFGLAKAVTGFIGDRKQNTTGVHSFFAYVESKRFQRLATEFGLLRIWKKGKMYGMDL